MDRDEKQFFIELLKEMDFKSHNRLINAHTVAKNIGMDNQRVDNLLRQWWRIGFWDWDYSKSIEIGWFDLEYLDREHKEIYDKMIAIIKEFINNFTIEFIEGGCVKQC